MARLTVRLPSTLRDQLAALAKMEGVSLNQYIVYSLARHATWAWTMEEMPGLRVTEPRVDYGASIRDSEPTPEPVRHVQELIARDDDDS